MKICIIAHSSHSLAGAELCLLKTIELLNREPSIKISIMVPREGVFFEQCKFLGLDCRVLGQRPWTYLINRPRSGAVKRWIRNIFSFVYLFFIVRKEKFDLIYSNTITVPVGAFAAFAARRAHVWHIHEFAGEHQVHDFEFGAALFQFLLNRPNNYSICASKALADFYQIHYSLQRFKTLYNPMVEGSGPGALSSRSKPSNRINLLIVGTVTPSKGQIDAVKATVELRRRGLRAQLSIVGPINEDYRKQLQQWLDEVGASGTDVVQFVGYVADPTPYYADADIALVCSPFEAFGRVTIEAILAGLPVIGANTGGTAEILGDDVRGITYRPGHPIELAEKIQYCLDDWDATVDRALAALDWAAENCTEEIYKKQMLSIFRGAISEPDPKRVE